LRYSNERYGCMHSADGAWSRAFINPGQKGTVLVNAHFYEA
jgi:hypothetical protein